MEEKKKRIRPTVREVNELKAELSLLRADNAKKSEELLLLRETIKKLKAESEKHLDGTSSIVKECDAWREKYHSLLGSIKEDDDAFNALKVKFDDLTKKYDNCCDELEKVRKEKYLLDDKCALLQSDLDDVSAELITMKSRSFWKRLFNFV